MGSLFGYVWGFFAIIASIYIAGNYDTSIVTLFFDPPSVFCTGGGTIAAIIIAHPFSDLMNMPKTFTKLFSYRLDDPVELIKKLVRYAELARKNGILALDGATDPTDDPFMAKGIQLAVDGIDPDQIRETMETELSYTQERHTSGRAVYNNIAKYAPAFGMIGTLIGLVIMLKNLTDVNLIGPAMAVALITTFYGAIMANLLAMPAADKLGNYDGSEKMNKEIIINGVLAIQSGDNPRMVEQKLKIYLPPKLRGAES